MSRWCYNRIKQSMKYYARVQNACLQGVERQGHSKTFESFLLLQTPIFENIQITHTLKTVQKSCLENFEINMKIN